MQFIHRLLHEMESATGGIDLEVSPGTIAFDRVAPLRHLPFELDFGERSSFRQIHFDAVAGRLDVSDVNQASERRGPEARNRSAASIQSKMVAGTFVVPTWRHDPGVFTV